MVAMCNLCDKVVTQLSGSGRIVKFTIRYIPTVVIIIIIIIYTFV